MSEAAAALSRTGTGSAREVPAVVLVHPAHDGDHEDGQADGEEPVADCETHHAERGRRGEDDRPPRPGAELALLRVAVVDVQREKVLRELATLRVVHTAELE